MHIINLKATPDEAWREALLAEYAFPHYWWLRGVTPESRRQLMDAELATALTGTHTLVLGCSDEAGDLQGFVTARHLEWDSQHFGHNIWRVDHVGVWGDYELRVRSADALVEAATAELTAQGVDCIQARIPVDNLDAVHCLEAHGYRTMEALTTWQLDLHRIPLPAQQRPDRARDSEPGDTEALVALARSVYTPTPDRFHVDPYLSSRASDELYAEWMRNSCTGKMADHISVAHDNGHIIGYATSLYHGDHDGRCNLRVGQLMLGGVEPAYRNQGVITDLIIRELEWMKSRDGDYCIVGTQVNNIASQIGWLKAGFRPGTASLTLHRWTTT